MSLILVIDDDPTVRILLKRAFASSGYNVQLAEDGLEGLQLAEKYKPALIICDWLMPKLSGLEVCQYVKKNPTLTTTFFVLMTSRVAVEDRVKGLDVGADDFICKPIDLQELKARVRAGLRLHQLSKDLENQKQLLETELSEAAEYVASLLPDFLTSEKVTITYHFIPSLHLGGDIFDYFFLDDKHLVFYLLDVSGHGLKAALPSISILNLLRSRSLGIINYYSPSEVLYHLNNNFQMTDKNDKYFTIWYGVLNLNNGDLTYSSAGHPPCILLWKNLLKNNFPTSLKTQGLPIGMFPNLTYQDNLINIGNSANLYLFSDGIYEVKNTEGKILGLENFIQLLSESKNDLKPILDFLRNYHNSSYFLDDLSIMHLKYEVVI